MCAKRFPVYSAHNHSFSDPLSYNFCCANQLANKGAYSFPFCLPNRLPDPISHFVSNGLSICDTQHPIPHNETICFAY
jgi:hypothetical protein